MNQKIDTSNKVIYFVWKRPMAFLTGKKLEDIQNIPKKGIFTKIKNIWANHKGKILLSTASIGTFLGCYYYYPFFKSDLIDFLSDHCKKIERRTRCCTSKFCIDAEQKRVDEINSNSSFF